MDMFEVGSTGHGGTARTAGALAKAERVRRALRHEEPDRVPISDFFWGSFVSRWQAELGLPAEVTPYAYYDLDWIVTVPNMDPWIRPFETLSETQDEVVVRTGFGAVMRKVFSLPMPEMSAWEVDTFETLEAAVFDDPRDARRFHEGGDNQIAGVGDGFARNSPPWLDGVKALWPEIPVYGSMIEVAECLTRLIGQANALLWMGLYPERMGKVIARIGEHYLECAKATMEAGEGFLDGFVIWGDVAYARAMLFSPSYWRDHYKPWVAAMIQAAHERGLPVIYHGCGNVESILPDFIEMGLDGYNPLEVKAGMDVVDLRQRYGHQMAFVGNSDMRVWEAGDEGALRREVLHRLSAAHGGGYIFQSDHSVSSGVSGATYDRIVGMVREYGSYPLELPAEG
jgi:uroporphyrinogen decarboxylase